MEANLKELAKNGTVRDIIRMGHPTLLRVAEDIDPTSIEAKQIMADLAATVESIPPSAGLAAPQINISKRILYYQVHAQREDEFTPGGIPPVFLINARFTPTTDEMISDWEACFSLPDLAIEVARYNAVKVTGFMSDGINVEPLEMEVKGYHARVLQHEIDHLDGRLSISRMQDPKRAGYLKEVTEFMR
ncbi:MAG: peptide deformylase [Alphaproteobacteria bacterium]